MEASHTNLQVIVKNVHTFDGKNAVDFIDWYEISALTLISTTRPLSEFYREHRYYLRRQTPTVPSSRPKTQPTRTCTTCCPSRRKVQHAPSSAALQERHSTRAQDTDNARGPPFAKSSTAVRRKRSKCSTLK